MTNICSYAKQATGFAYHEKSYVTKTTITFKMKEKQGQIIMYYALEVVGVHRNNLSYFQYLVFTIWRAQQYY